MSENQNSEQRSRRGFAAMSPERQRQIASLGGRTAHEQGVAHQWDRQQAIAAGRKGGQASGKRRSADRNDREPLL
jgi:uncharacterized protein